MRAGDGPHYGRRLMHNDGRATRSPNDVARQGFALVELLVVIVILSGLAVVGVLALGGHAGSARTPNGKPTDIAAAKSVTARTEFAQVETAIGLYLAVNPTDSYATLGADPLPALKSAGLLKSTADLCTYAVNSTVAPATLTQGGAAVGCSAANTATL